MPCTTYSICALSFNILLCEETVVCIFSDALLSQLLSFPENLLARGLANWNLLNWSVVDRATSVAVHHFVVITTAECTMSSGASPNWLITNTCGQLGIMMIMEASRWNPFDRLKADDLVWMLFPWHHDTAFLISLVNRRCKEEEEELERILQLSLTEKWRGWRHANGRAQLFFMILDALFCPDMLIYYVLFLNLSCTKAASRKCLSRTSGWVGN